MHQNSGSISVIDIPDHCGNAPRKIVLRDFLLALYQRDTAYVVAQLADDIRWEVVGETVLNGTEQVRDFMAARPEVQALHLFTVITHGTECAADGVITLSDGSSRGFSHVLRFAGHSKTAKLKEIRSYLVSREATVQS